MSSHFSCIFFHVSSSPDELLKMLPLEQLPRCQPSRRQPALSHYAKNAPRRMQKRKAPVRSASCPAWLVPMSSKFWIQPSSHRNVFTFLMCFFRFLITRRAPENATHAATASMPAVETSTSAEPLRRGARARKARQLN